MHILQTPVRLQSPGGVETYVHELSTELIRRGHEVTILCAESSGSRTISPGIKVRTLRAPFKIANTEITPSLLFRILKEKPDIIHTHLPTPWSADCSGCAAVVRGIPLVMSYHNRIVGQGPAGAAAALYERTSLPLLLKAAGRVIVLREEIKAYLPPRVQRKTAVVPPGVDAIRFSPANVDTIGDIFFISVLDTWHHYKGLDLLLQALVLVKNKHPDIRLVVGGEGPAKAFYQDMAVKLGLSENVLFTGYIPRHTLPGYYRGCRMNVLPSLSIAQEGFGMVALEAMACGTPVITTTVPGVAPLLAQSGAGLVVGRNHPGALADAICYLMEHDDERRRMGVAGRSVIEERYTWERVAAQIEMIYGELLKK